MEIEKCLKSLFPELDTKKDNLLDQTKKLGSDLQSFLEKIKKFEFPSKQQPYPIDYSISESSRLFLYALCKIIKPKTIVETGVAYGLSTSYILQALYENKTGTLYSIDSEFKPEPKEYLKAIMKGKMVQSKETDDNTLEPNAAPIRAFTVFSISASCITMA
jgi:predicted O-methyltransferase YrrM